MKIPQDAHTIPNLVIANFEQNTTEFLQQFEGKFSIDKINNEIIIRDTHDGKIRFPASQLRDVLIFLDVCKEEFNI